MESSYKVVDYKKENKNSWCIGLEREKDKRIYYMDLNIDKKYHDIIAEWNQYIFDNSQEDQERLKIQDNINEYISASDQAINYLQAIHEIEQNKKGLWKTVNPFKKLLLKLKELLF